MTNEKQKTTASEVCTIRIIFPVQSDEQALACKRKVREVLSDIPDVNVQFSMMDIPSQPSGKPF